MLDGQGADEQLAGYHSCFAYYVPGLIREKQWAMLARTMLERRLFHGLSFERPVSIVYSASSSGEARSSRSTRDQGASQSRLARLRGFPQHRYIARGARYSACSPAVLGPVRDIGDICMALTAWNVTLPFALGGPQQHGAFSRGASPVPRPSPR